MIRYLLLLCFLFLAECGGGGSSGASPPAQAPSPGTFWAIDFTNSASYTVSAAKVAEGVHCQIFLENGQSVPQADINAIMTQFDSAIYPNEITAFGSEPNPGIDGDPKIYILLLNVKDGFTPGTSSSFVAGYFDPTNEYALSSQNPHSNQKELLVMNINPAAKINSSGTAFFASIAHEFQHLIHWEQKTRQRGVNDDTWIDEAMAQVARTYCGYGPDYASVFNYEHDMGLNVNHSLTNFDETVGNYGMVYMWAQYFKDRIGGNIFHAMLHNNLTGINSVNAALATEGSGKDFTSTFRDWALANFFGDGTTVEVPLSNPAWSYTSINTGPGLHTYNNGQDSVTLPGLFPTSRQNPTTLQALDQWSLGYYSFTPADPGAATGTVTWTRNASTTTASFINGNTASASVTFDMVPGTPNTFTNVGYLVYENPSLTTYLSSPSPVDTVAHTSIMSVAAAPAAVATPVTARTPREMLAAMDASFVVRRFVQETGKPHPAYVDFWFRERERTLRVKGIRPPF